MLPLRGGGMPIARAAQSALPARSAVD